MSDWRVVTNEFEGCQGNGFIECLCAGDFCACINQGEVECVGCPDCKGYDEDGNDKPLGFDDPNQCQECGDNLDNDFCWSCDL
jgi:hypothetical protein